MGLREEYDFDSLVNETERYVIEELEKQLSESDTEICSCHDCILDMAALALNAVPPLYRASLLGKVYAESLSLERADEIRKAVADAVSKVSSNPSHD